jgi:hypothetical protein
LVIPETDENLLAVVVFESKADAEADEEDFRQRAVKAIPLLVGPPRASF